MAIYLFDDLSDLAAFFDKLAERTNTHVVRTRADRAARQAKVSAYKDCASIIARCAVDHILTRKTEP